MGLFLFSSWPSKIDVFFPWKIVTGHWKINLFDKWILGDPVVRIGSNWINTLRSRYKSRDYFNFLVDCQKLRFIYSECNIFNHFWVILEFVEQNPSLVPLRSQRSLWMWSIWITGAWSSSGYTYITEDTILENKMV